MRHFKIISVKAKTYGPKAFYHLMVKCTIIYSISSIIGGGGGGGGGV